MQRAIAMKSNQGLCASLPLALAFLAAASLPVLADPVAMDTPITVNGIDTVCTGIADSKDDPRWKTYPVRVEFSNGGQQYLAGAHVTLAKGGNVLADLECQASWVLFRLPPGSYSVTASILGSNAKPSTAKFSPPRRGQKRVVLRFSDFQANQ
jgi:hypothetical protein